MKNLSLFNNKTEKNKDYDHQVFDHYGELAKLVKEARIQQNLTLQELSHISKIPVHLISSIENNDKNIRPKDPFLRSILIKLELCLALKKNTLLKLAIRQKDSFKNEKNNFLIMRFDFINTWQGSLLYFFILVLTIFILKRYFVQNVNVIEMQNIENKIFEK